MRSWVWGLAGAVVMGGSGVASSAGAQERALSGVVRGLQGQPVAGARVRTENGKGRTLSDADGRYRLTDGFKGDSVELVVTRIGYEPTSLTVLVKPGENRLDIFMQSKAQRVDSVAVVGERRGIFGIVVDTGGRPMDGVRVALVSAAGRTRTDEGGRFTFDDARPGPQAMHVTSKGYVSRMVTVEVPPTGGARVLVWLRRVDPAEPTWRGGERLDPLVVNEASTMLVRRGQVRGPWVGLPRARLEAAMRAGHETVGDMLRASTDNTIHMIMMRSPALNAPRQAVGCLVLDGLSAVFSTLDDYLLQDLESVELYNSGRGANAALCVRMISRRE